ncbi:MAG: MATE family efflux transporter [Spirochaetales bacterium]|uniref:MATE family efflux transporter n=1 Tax=Candidatus Thalassospirochaeta sargassi TaxID=3119039 RepID=A0AAJ1MIS1_9SPIO|nr:MATE family efflux transporter [Spirochaetales bacterium]
MKNTKLDLGKDPILKIFIHYAVPSVLGMLSMSTAQIIDGIFIGRFVGAEGLAAVNLAWPLVMVFSGISLMIGIGGSTLANIARGAEKHRKADNLYTVTMLALAIFSVLVLLLGLSLLRFIPVILGADDSIELLVQNYLRIILLFAPLFMLTFTQDLFIRGDGSPVFPVAMMLAGSVTNIICDWLLVGRLGFDIEGAALATGFSQVIPFVTMQIFLSLKTRWKLIKPVFKIREFARMCYNGVSEFVDETSIGISVYIFNLVLMNRIGASGVAAYSIAAYVGEIFGIIFYGTAQAIHAGVSFNKGAGDARRVRGFRNLAIFTNIGFGLIAFILLQFFRDKAAAVFVNDAEVIALASEISFFYSFALILMGINMTAAMFFTAIDQPTQSAIIALSRSLVMLLIGLFLLPLFLGNTGIWLSFVFAEGVTLILALRFFRRDRI